MQGARSVWTIILLALCLFSTALLCVARNRRPVLPRPLPARRLIRPLRSQSEVALIEAKATWVWGILTTSRSLEQLEEWDPAAATATDHSERWRELVAQNPEVRRACQSAVRAVVLARNSDEQFRAARLLALIECAQGHHREDLQQARQLVALAPRDELALLWLRRAARCNHLKSLEQRANAALAALARRGPTSADQRMRSGARREPGP
jgi:hypothetical protein